jgi:hypothetical protein
MIGHARTSLRSLAVVVSQHAAEALPAPDIAIPLTDLAAGIDDPVFQSLMIAFLVIVVDELFQGPLQCSPTEEDHSVETLGLEGSHVAFNLGVQIWTPGRQ